MRSELWRRVCLVLTYRTAFQPLFDRARSIQHRDDLGPNVPSLHAVRPWWHHGNGNERCGSCAVGPAGQGPQSTGVSSNRRQDEGHYPMLRYHPSRPGLSLERAWILWREDRYAVGLCRWPCWTGADEEVS